MDLFQKCFEFTRADEVKAAGLYPYFRPIQQNDGPVVIMEGRRVIMCGSNNYLGLTAHPKVREAAINAIKKYGSGCSGSRYLNGTLEIHVELESKLAEFFQREDCLIFSTGYQTAQGVIPTLLQKGDYVYTDKDNHASIVAGYLMAKGMSAEYVRYKHNDMEDLERLLEHCAADDKAVDQTAHHAGVRRGADAKAQHQGLVCPGTDPRHKFRHLGRKLGARAGDPRQRDQVDKAASALGDQDDALPGARRGEEIDEVEPMLPGADLKLSPFVRG